MVARHAGARRALTRPTASARWHRRDGMSGSTSVRWPSTRHRHDRHRHDRHRRARHRRARHRRDGHRADGGAPTPAWRAGASTMCPDEAFAEAPTWAHPKLRAANERLRGMGHRRARHDDPTAPVIIDKRDIDDTAAIDNTLSICRSCASHGRHDRLRLVRYQRPRSPRRHGPVSESCRACTVRLSSSRTRRRCQTPRGR